MYKIFLPVSVFCNHICWLDPKHYGVFHRKVFHVSLKMTNNDTINFRLTATISSGGCTIQRAYFLLPAQRLKCTTADKGNTLYPMKTRNNSHALRKSMLYGLGIYRKN